MYHVFNEFSSERSLNYNKTTRLIDLEILGYFLKTGFVLHDQPEQNTGLTIIPTSHSRPICMYKIAVSYENLSSNSKY